MLLQPAATAISLAFALSATSVAALTIMVDDSSFGYFMYGPSQDVWLTRRVCVCHYRRKVWKNWFTQSFIAWRPSFGSSLQGNGALQCNQRSLCRILYQRTNYPVYRDTTFQTVSNSNRDRRDRSHEINTGYTTHRSWRYTTSVIHRNSINKKSITLDTSH
jgi:hypothetical protein